MTGLVWGVGLALFLCGLAAVMLRRQLLAMLLGLELMITGVNIPLVHHASRNGDPAGLAAALIIIAVAAAEAVIGLTLIIQVSRSGETPEAPVLGDLRG